MNMTLSSASTLGQSEPRSYGIEWLLHIPQSQNQVVLCHIQDTNWWGLSYLSAETQ